MGPTVDPSQFATNEVILPNLLPMRSWSIVAGAQALSKGAIAAILVWRYWCGFWYHVVWTTRPSILVSVKYPVCYVNDDQFYSNFCPSITILLPSLVWSSGIKQLNYKKAGES
jgi:hypothetical protein